MDPHEEKALSDIDKHGCHVIHVFEDDQGPKFTYSVGIERKSKQPELIITGLDKELAHWIINEYNRRIRSGEVFQADQPYSGFLNDHVVIFKPMSQTHYSEYLGWDLWLYGNSNFRVFQMIWPSTAGVWPWDPHAPSEYLWNIPRLGNWKN